MALDELFGSIWKLLSGDSDSDKATIPRANGTGSSSPTVVSNEAPPTEEMVAVDDLECEKQKIEARIARIQNDIARENECIRKEMLPYSRNPSKMSRVARINVQARIHVRKEMENQLGKLYLMRTKLMKHIYNVESAGSQKLYTSAVRNTLKNGKLFTTENDVHMAEDTIEQQQELEYRQREMDQMISYGTNIEVDDEELEEEVMALFASEQSTTSIFPSIENNPSTSIEQPIEETMQVASSDMDWKSVTQPALPYPEKRYRSKELTAFEDIM